MREILHRFLPCISNRQAVLENFNEKEQEILELFPTKMIIPTNRIKIVKAISTQNGDQLFIATMRVKQQTRQVALQQIVSTGREDENITRLLKLFERARRMSGKRAKNFINPRGITVMRYQRFDALCLVLDWPSDMQNQTFVSYLQRNETSVSTQIQLLRDILTGIQHLRYAKIINPDAYNITVRHLFIDGGLNVKIGFYGLKINPDDAILGPNETFETRLVWNIGMILSVISGAKNGPLRAFKAACLEDNPEQRPKFTDLIREFDAIFSKNGEKYQSQMCPISSPYFQRSPEVARHEKKYQKGKLENTKPRILNPNVTFHVTENFTDYDTDSTGVQL